MSLSGGPVKAVYLGREGERSGGTHPLWGVTGGTGENPQRHAAPQESLREGGGVGRCPEANGVSLAGGERRQPLTGSRGRGPYG